MKAAIFSGTTEGRILSQRLAADGIDVMVFVATEYGEQEQQRAAGDSSTAIHVGRLTAEEMEESMGTADLCIDATHPYARQVTENVRGACKKAMVPYYRVSREESVLQQDDHVTVVYSVQEAAAWLKGKEGNILLTTGTKELRAFGMIDPERLYPRVLPFVESIEACEKAGIPSRNIIAMQGPFSQELNEALIRQIGADWLVTKDSGKTGGFMEKMEAVKQCGIGSVVIARPDDMGFSVEEIHEICRRMMK